MKNTAFREYDIRGKVGDELTVEDVYDVTNAIIYYLKEKNPTLEKVVVGMDGRTHSPAIKDELCRALIDAGLQVTFIGVCPSPVLYFCLHTIPVDAGLMITASHNPAEYNGIKISLGIHAIWGKEIQQIARYFNEKKKVISTKKGTITEYNAIVPYVQQIAEQFKQLVGAPLKAVIDCGNGAAGTVMPLLIKKMQWTHIDLLYPEVDGRYPHHEADPTVEKNMRDVKELLKTRDYTVGFGLDGDCDRVAAMTKQGTLVPGDQILALFAQQVLAKHPQSTVVFDIKSSSGLVDLLKQWGAKPCMSPVGHAIVKEHMNKSGALVGGELSGHFFFSDRYFGFDDGIYALMRLIEIIVMSKKKLEELLAVFPHKFSTQEYRIFCPEEKKATVIGELKELFSKRQDVQLITIDGVRIMMPYGWGIIRSSNTQPALSIRCESDSQEGLNHIKHDFLVALTPYIDTTELQG